MSGIAGFGKAACQAFSALHWALLPWALRKNSKWQGRCSCSDFEKSIISFFFFSFFFAGVLPTPRMSLFCKKYWKVPSVLTIFVRWVVGDFFFMICLSCLCLSFSKEMALLMISWVAHQTGIYPLRKARSGLFCSSARLGLRKNLVQSKYKYVKNDFTNT